MVPRLAVTTRRRLVSELDACTPRRIKRLGPVRSNAYSHNVKVRAESQADPG
jgi:hypothetical protein